MFSKSLNLIYYEILAQEIIDSLESALNSFREVVKSLSKDEWISK